MGLDMYLHKVKWLDATDQAKHNLPKNATKITFEIGYWRKANAIHKWFVDNVQDGEDDCGNYEVSKEQLQKLLDIVNKILSCNDKLAMDEQARLLLPPQEGFFFGTTDIDEWYYENLKHTQKLLTKLCKGKSDYFEYHSSW